MSDQGSRAFIRDLRAAWRDEMNSAANYRALAVQERDGKRKEILLRMAEQEEKHAGRWADRLRSLGVEPGTFRPSFAERMRRRMLLKSALPEAVRMLENLEQSADLTYERLLASARTDADRTHLREAQLEEKAHAKVLQEMIHGGAHHPESRLQRILSRERWHVKAGGWIGQAIYGMNDGLGAAFGVVSGVAGATSANQEFVLLSGLAATVASALSMGSGAYLAAKSEREVYEAEMERERRELQDNPEEEKEELELFYQLKGFSAEEARLMADRLADSPEHMLQTLAHEELGLSEASFPNPWRSAFSATLSTAIGAAIPVIPFFFAVGIEALIWSFVVSTAAHFVVGASKVLVTGRSWLISGTEMTLVGLGEAVITYVIGLWIAPYLG